MIKQVFKKIFKSFFTFLLTLFLIVFLITFPAEAKIEVLSNDSDIVIQRSLESLRDLDLQTWQLIVYPKIGNDKQLILRIVGFVGSLRLNHPKQLEVTSGIKTWVLEDITLKNPELVNDARDAAAEFALEPLIQDLQNNRPLRLFLDGGFNELPVPPYVVNEWRTIKSLSLEDGY